MVLWELFTEEFFGEPFGTFVPFWSKTILDPIDFHSTDKKAILKNVILKNILFCVNFSK